MSHRMVGKGDTSASRDRGTGMAGSHRRATGSPGQADVIFTALMAALTVTEGATLVLVFC
jgi:hypothetical protein